MLLVIILALLNMPMAWASPTQDAFPDITFRAFSNIVDEHFGSKISLATVLCVLFTLTNNIDLLNLHARQQNPQQRDERKNYMTGWITALAQALQEKLDGNVSSLFRKDEGISALSHEQVTNTLAIKLDTLAKGLSLNPYNDHGVLERKLEPVSERKLEPALVICPQSMECEQPTCKKGSL